MKNDLKMMKAQLTYEKDVKQKIDREAEIKLRTFEMYNEAFANFNGLPIPKPKASQQP